MDDRCPVQNPRVAWRVYDGEAVIVSPDDSSLHTLNAVGTFIWESADGRTRVGEIVRRLCEAFEVGPDRAERDVAAFVENLTGRGLLTLTDAPTS